MECLLVSRSSFSSSSFNVFSHGFKETAGTRSLSLSLYQTTSFVGCQSIRTSCFIRPHVHSRPSTSTRRPRQKRLTWFWLKPRRAARHGAVTFETQSSAAAIQISGDVLKTFNSPQCSPCRDSYTYVHNFFKISDGWSRAT